MLHQKGLLGIREIRWSWRVIYSQTLVKHMGKIFFFLHIFSFSGIENKDRARRAYWAVSGKHIPLPNKKHTKPKPAFTRFFFYSICLAVIYKRPLMWDCLRKKQRKGLSVPSLVFSAPGHFSVHLKGKCHKIHKHNRVLHLYALLSLATVLVI